MTSILKISNVSINGDSVTIEFDDGASQTKKLSDWSIDASNDLGTYWPPFARALLVLNWISTQNIQPTLTLNTNQVEGIIVKQDG